MSNLLRLRLSISRRWGAIGSRDRAGGYVLAVLAGALALGAGSARAAAYLPPPGKVFAGVGPGNPVFYERQTLTHPAVLNDYITWYGAYGWLLARADTNHMRSMISLMTNLGFHMIRPASLTQDMSSSLPERSRRARETRG
jgi:hypothetical protein